MMHSYEHAGSYASPLRARFHPLAVALAAICAAGWSSAQTSDPVNPQTPESGKVTVEPVYVIADPDRGDVPSAREQRERFLRRPGAEVVVNTREWLDKKIGNFEDAFALTPGIHAFARTDSVSGLYSIRGSDIATEGPRNGRGIRAYQDGVPLGRTEAGITNALMDMLAADYVEVYRGPNSLRFGALATGGAINLVSKTGRNFEGHGARVAFGSFRYRQGQYEFGSRTGRWDTYVSASHSHSDGYREHDVSEYVRLTGNVGLDLGGGMSGRLYLHAGRTRDESSGTLPLASYAANPRHPGQFSKEFDTDANFEYGRMGVRLTQRISSAQRAEIDLYGMWIRFDHHPTPFSGLVDRTWREAGVSARYSGVHRVGDREIELVGGVRYNGSSGDFLTWQHRNGGQSRGPKVFDADFDSGLVEAYAESAIRLSPAWRVFLGAQYARGRRSLDEHLISPAVPSCSPAVGAPPPFCQALGRDRPQPGSSPVARDRLNRFETFNPKLGANWEWRPGWFAFASLARSFEAPTDSDVASGAQINRDIRPQRAWTAEVGLRGGNRQLSADVTAYTMRIRDEILSECRPGIPNCAQNIAFNASRTLHQGIEAGLGLRLARGLVSKDDEIRLDGVWNYADMRFRNDPKFGNNRLPVIPRHTLHLELTHKFASGWHWGVNLHHVGYRTTTYDGSGGGAFIVPAHSLYGARFGYADPSGLWRVALDARNLADKAYVAQFTAIPTRGTRSTPDIRPGVGRAIYLTASVVF